MLVAVIAEIPSPLIPHSEILELYYEELYFTEWIVHFSF